MANGINQEALAIMAGQLAGAIAPGSIGAGLGAVGAQAGQGNILASAAADRQTQLRQLINSLTADGTQTTGLTLGEDGTIKFTGQAAPRTEGTEIGSPVQGALDTQNVPVTTGGGNQTTNPFFNLLGTLDPNRSLV